MWARERTEKSQEARMIKGDRLKARGMYKKNGKEELGRWRRRKRRRRCKGERKGKRNYRHGKGRRKEAGV